MIQPHPAGLTCGVFFAPKSASDLPMLETASFSNRLLRNARHWDKWARRQGITCYRVYDRDLPQFPLVLERYGAHLHLQEIDTGWQQTKEEHAAWLSEVVANVANTLDVPAARIHFKRR